MINESNKIIIIGAGLAGLTLANSLQIQGIPFEICERDHDADARGQGWSLTLHFALKSLRECVPEEAFEKISEKVCVTDDVDEPISFAFRNADNREAFFTMNTEPGVAYRINRNRFRKWLLNPVQDCVQWNKKMTHYEENIETVTAFFDDGTQTTCGLLVAADGVHSPVACQLLGGKEKFKELTNVLDVRVFSTSSWVSKEDWASVSEYPLHICGLTGKMKEDDNIKEKTFGMFVCVQGIDESRSENPIQVLRSISRYDGEGVIPKFTENENAEALNLVKSWARNGLPEDSIYRKFVTNADDNTKITSIFIRERTPTPELLEAPNRRVVLVGDAAHPISMFRGEGGNHAIADAGNLAAEIGLAHSGSKDLDEAIAAYYAEMIPRGQKAVQKSHQAAMVIHTKPEYMLQMFKGMKDHHDASNKSF